MYVVVYISNVRSLKQYISYAYHEVYLIYHAFDEAYLIYHAYYEAYLISYTYYEAYLISCAAEGAPDWCPVRLEAPLPLEHWQQHGPELEILSNKIKHHSPFISGEHSPRWIYSSPCRSIILPAVNNFFSMKSRKSENSIHSHKKHIHILNYAFTLFFFSVIWRHLQ